jgi:hypothetical protein
MTAWNCQAAPWKKIVLNINHHKGITGLQIQILRIGGIHFPTTSRWFPLREFLG